MKMAGAAERLCCFFDDGFYPVTPTVPTYDIASPVFEKITIRLSNGKDFRDRCEPCIEAKQVCAEGCAEWKALEHVWFRHSDLVRRRHA